jgi:UDP-N-acetylmuramoyl-tripeptide--D-alanyl-D-alanine ligase
MTMFTLHQAHAWLPGGRWSATATSRAARAQRHPHAAAGDLFVAIHGERFDANDFIADAQAKGAVAAIAHRGKIPAGFSGIEVDDSKLALGQLAAGLAPASTFR